MSVISSSLTHATKMETQGGTLVTLLDTNGNASGQAPTQEKEKFSFSFARLHSLICLRFTRVNRDNANANAR